MLGRFKPCLQSVFRLVVVGWWWWWWCVCVWVVGGGGGGTTHPPPYPPTHPSNASPAPRFGLSYVHLVEPRTDDLPLAAFHNVSGSSARPDSLAPFRQVCMPAAVGLGVPARRRSSRASKTRHWCAGWMT